MTVDRFILKTKFTNTETGYLRTVTLTVPIKVSDKVQKFLSKRIG